MEMLQLHFDQTKKKKVKTKLMLLIGSSGILVTVFTIIDIVLFVDKITVTKIGYDVVGYVYPMITMVIMTLQFSTFILLIHERFIWINSILQKIQQQRNENNLKNLFCRLQKPYFLSHVASNLKVSEKTIDLIESLRRRHFDLTLTCQELNSIYNSPILLTILYIFITVVFAMYFSFVEVSKAKQRSPILYFVCFSVISAVNILVLYCLLILPSNLQVEASHTADLLHAINYKTEQMETYISHFSLQIIHQKIEFTACHLFPLNQTLLFSIISSVTTYLVIVIQLQTE